MNKIEIWISVWFNEWHMFGITHTCCSLFIGGEIQIATILYVNMYLESFKH